MERLPKSPMNPSPMDEYVLVWSSFNEGTQARDSKVRPVKERVTLKEKLAELRMHLDKPGMQYPIIYASMLFYGDRYAYVHTDWMTNVPRGEDLYFERR